MLRHSPATSAAITAWAQRLAAYKDEDEARAFEAVAQPKVSALGEDEDRVLRAFGGNLTLGVLSLAGFANGHTHCVQHLSQVCVMCGPEDNG